jgi:hypothetical protein
MQLTTIIIAAIATATLAIASPVNGAAAGPPPPVIFLDCLKCKAYDDNCRKVSHLPQSHTFYVPTEANSSKQSWACWLPGANCGVSCPLDTCRNNGEMCHNKCGYNC